MFSKSDDIKKIISIRSLLIYGLLVLIILLLFSHKENYFIDETWSYGLANHQNGGIISFEDGKKYDPKSLYNEYLNVQPEERFDYKNVWQNQVDDNHPPLFYALLHTFSSLFPNRFSKWYGAAINIFFGILLIYFLRKYLRSLTGNADISDLLSLAFVLTAGFWNELSFIRMYLMAMCWVTLLALCSLRILDSDHKDSLSEEVKSLPGLYISLFATATIGALTHYYVVIYDILLFCTLAIILIRRKQLIALGLSFVSELLAAIAAYLVFPGILHHLFVGDRGTESLNNLTKTASFYEQFKSFFYLLNHNFFGGLLLAMLCAGLFYTLFRKVLLPRDTERVPKSLIIPLDSRQTQRYLLNLIPCFLFFLIVCKSAPTASERYLSPIFAVFFGSFLCFLFSLFSKYCSQQNVLSLLMVFVVSLTIAGSYDDTRLAYLFKGSDQCVATAEQYADCDCLILYSAPWEVPTAYREASKYKTITMLNRRNLDQLDSLDVANNEKLILIILVEFYENPDLEILLEHYDHLTHTKKLFSTSALATTYYLTA